MKPWLILRMLISSLMIMATVFGISVFAATYTDNSQATFPGTFANTSWDVPTTGLKINTGFAGCTSLTSTTCSYTSEVKNSGDSAAVWNNLAWTPSAPYLKELPNNQAIETGYPNGNVDMTGNLALWHLNETAASPTSFADSSGNGNSLTCGPNCPVTSTVSPWGNARSTNSTSRYLISSNGNSVKNLSRVSLSLWVTNLTNTGREEVIYEEPVNTTNADDRFSLRLTSDGQLLFRGRTNDTAVSPTTWVSIPAPGSGNFNIIAVFDSVTDVHSLYVNGVGTSNTVAENSFSNTDPASPARIARSANNTLGFEGNFDEIALFNRSLSSSEVLNFYQRGVSQNIRFQIRSCNDSACSAENFVGPGGLTTTFFAEQTQLTGSTPSFALSTLVTPNNQYIQYRFYLASASTTISPLLKSATITYQTRPSLAFSIRNSADTANSNLCNLGTASSNSLSTCSYRLKPSTNAASGYSVLVQTSNFISGANSISNAAIGTGGGGGSAITAATVGTEQYGAVITPGTTTSGAVIARTTAFNAGATNSVLFNTVTSTAIVQSSGINLPSATDLNNTILMTHNLNISGATRAGNYSQTVTYTVIPNF